MRWSYLGETQQRGVDGLFFQPINPTWTSPSQKANTWGRSIAVSVMPINWNCFWRARLRAMMKNHGPSGEPWIWVAWMSR